MAEKTYRQYADLEDALEKKNIPRANRPLIRAFVAAIGCSRFDERDSYIKATRIKPGPPLLIAYGWSSGFATEQEAEAAGGVKVWKTGLRWGIDHPVSKDTGPRKREPVTSDKFCTTCNEGLSLTGECPKDHPQPPQTSPVSRPGRPSTGS